MDQVLAALDATWRILLIGVVLGAGLPAAFAVGVYALAWSTTDQSEDDDQPLRPTLRGRIVATVMFSLVVLAVLAGVGYIVAHGFGMSITFNGVVPVFSSKH